MIDLTNWIGEYVPITNPDGSIVAGLSGVDFAYIGRLAILLIIVSISLTLLVSIVKAVFRR